MLFKCEIMASAVRGIVSFWKRQESCWRVIVSRAVTNRFFENLTVDYSNIYVRELGATPVQIGTVNSFASISSAAIATPVGWLQDRYSIRKMFIIGIGLLTLVPLIYALAFDWMMIIPAIVLAALAGREGACSVICDISLKNEDRATGKAICEGLGSAPSLTAPAIAALIITFFGGISAMGIRPLYWIQFVGRFVIFLSVFIQLKEIIRPKVDRNKSSFLGDFRELFDNGVALKRWIVLDIVETFTMGMMNPFRTLFAYEVKGAEQFIIGWMATARIVGQVLFSTPIGRLADRIGRKKAFFIMTPLSCASNLLLVFAPKSASGFLVLSAIFFGFFTISRIVVESPMRSELVRIEYIGRWRGILGLITGLVGIPAPIVGGIVWEYLDPAYVFLIPLTLELLVRIPIMITMPETLRMQDKKR